MRQVLVQPTSRMIQRSEERKSAGDKQAICCYNRRSGMAEAVIVDTDETSTPPTYGTSDTLNTAYFITMQLARNPEGPVSGSSSSNLAKIWASSK